MPPKKATPKPTSDDNVATGLILDYLVTQNRPYSATEISSNLHNAVTKTRTDKLLKEMFERNEIGGRASGKQWVYWAIQVGVIYNIMVAQQTLTKRLGSRSFMLEGRTCSL